MLCSQCQETVPPGGGSCASCASPVGPVPCPVCQCALFGKEAFCPRCGSLLSRSADPLGARHLAVLKSYLPERSVERIFSASSGMVSERRYAAVVFADVSGFTAMSESMEPEVVVEVMNGVFEGMVRAVHHYDGTVDKFIGDAVLAVFGAPISHDNDPERAVLASLEMRRAVKDFSEKSGRTLSLSIGINAGPLVAGTVGGDGRLNYTVMGDTVNVAQRLESAAKTEQVLVTREIHQRTRESVRYRPLPPIRVKGKRNPIDVWEARDTRSRSDPRHRHLTMVGRDQELVRLEAFAAGSAVRQGVLVGPGGAGRSTLLTAFTERRVAVGAATAMAACPRYANESYPGLVTEVVARLLRVRIDQGPGAVTDGLLRLQELGLSEVEASLLLASATRTRPDSAELDASTTDRARLAAFVRVLTFSAAGKPLLVILEDVQWASPTDLRDLKGLLGGTLPPGVNLLVSLRDVGLDALGDVSRLPHLRLEPFDLETTRKMVCMQLELPMLDDRSAERVFRLTAGSPRMIRELLDTWTDQGLIFAAHQRWIVSPKILDAPPPPSIDALISSRLDELDEDSLRFMRAAAVVGSTFEPEVVRRIAALQVDLEWAVSQLSDRGFIETDPEKGWAFRFRHERYQAVAAAGLSDRERRAMHQRAGLYLEETTDPSDPRIARLIAEHHAEGTDHEKATKALLHAARRAEQTYQLDNAIELLERILSIATPHGYRNYDLSRCETEVDEALYRLGLAYLQRGVLDEAEDRLQWAYARSRQFFQGDFRVWSLLGLARVHARTGRTEKAGELLETAAADSEGMRDAALVAISLLERARLNIASAQYPEALKVIDAAFTAEEKATDEDRAILPLPLSRALILYEAGAANAGKGHIPEAVRCFHDARTEAQASGDLHVAARAALAMVEAHAQKGDPVAATRLCEEAITGFRKVGDRIAEGSAQHQLALVQIVSGDGVAARQSLRRAGAIFDEVGHEEGRVVVSRARQLLPAEGPA